LTPLYILLSRYISHLPPNFLVQLRSSLKEEDVDLLEELFVQEGIIFDPDTVVLDIDSACHDAASRQIASLVQAVEELTETVQEVYIQHHPNLKPASSLLLLLSCGLTLLVDDAAH
jgi:kinesin family protein 5